MSQWATLDAKFWDADGFSLTVAEVSEGIPTGSENGATVRQAGSTIYAHGLLRGFCDEDAPGALAWFLKNARWARRGKLEIDIDSGPRYRYEWENGKLTKLRGILD